MDSACSNAERTWSTVEAGAILQVVQETVADQGLRFPLDLGARGSCTIGGNIATNAGGINVLRYGMMRNLVLGLERDQPLDLSAVDLQEVRGDPV